MMGRWRKFHSTPCKVLPVLSAEDFGKLFPISGFLRESDAAPRRAVFHTYSTLLDLITLGRQEE